ncbi:hypothetical protein PV336_04400 [Streptomyces sp. MI02-2A]|uniref:hypothetical protein n=1 Tax=unclassified Streptomyces TaxID=2593676 RepID=UPI001F20123D|nr:MULTISPECIES: hypothetical protein [unclassified Streptomyces]MDX3258482.1 hypothetical protein [Streptomyces sp. MI02-2A]
MRLPDGRIALSQRLTSVLATQIDEQLASSSTIGRSRRIEGEVYQMLSGDGPVVKVLAGSTRHAVLTVVRAR